LLLWKSAYTQQQPAGSVGGCIFGSAVLGGCRLVVEQTTSRTTKFFDPLLKKGGEVAAEQQLKLMLESLWKNRKWRLREPF
jgi:hypothetical protein